MYASEDPREYPTDHALTILAGPFFTPAPGDLLFLWRFPSRGRWVPRPPLGPLAPTPTRGPLITRPGSVGPLHTWCTLHPARSRGPLGIPFATTYSPMGTPWPRTPHPVHSRMESV